MSIQPGLFCNSELRPWKCYSLFQKTGLRESSCHPLPTPEGSCCLSPACWGHPKNAWLAQWPPSSQRCPHLTGSPAQPSVGEAKMEPDWPCSQQLGSKPPAAEVGQGELFPQPLPLQALTSSAHIPKEKMSTAVPSAISEKPTASHGAGMPKMAKPLTPTEGARSHLRTPVGRSAGSAGLPALYGRGCGAQAEGLQVGREVHAQEGAQTGPKGVLQSWLPASKCGGLDEVAQDTVLRAEGFDSEMGASKDPLDSRERCEEATPGSFTYPLQKHDARLWGGEGRKKKAVTEMRGALTQKLQKSASHVIPAKASCVCFSS